MNALNKNQLNFLQIELYDWAQMVDRRLKQTLMNKEISNGEGKSTGDLLRSLSYQVFVASGGNSGSYQLSFLEYGRFVDMGAGRKAKFETIEGNTNRLKKRKPEKWYAKKTSQFIFGNLIDRLYNNYSAAVVYTLKQIENGGINQNG